MLMLLLQKETIMDCYELGEIQAWPPSGERLDGGPEATTQLESWRE